MHNCVFRDAFVSVEVTLLDVNDNSPTFVPNNQYSFKTRVDSPIGSTIGKVYLIDLLFFGGVGGGGGKWYSPRTIPIYIQPSINPGQMTILSN